ncbi:ATPase [uncultured Methanobrevibacter sp.]|uniref:ATPase n=1 Tax=uncultured Methanobrevibacter sp. TaxID=253161 RepID=UPI0026365724|nr:ATPase [uncultured Methanobrevibacter sp.]
MACHYHPEREATDICAICGKEICKECGLEIAGKIYCKDCLEKIVGLGVASSAQETVAEPEPEPVQENIYQPQEEYEIPYAQEEPAQEYKVISDDSPYNIKDNIEYSGGLESSYISEDESIYQQQPEVAQNEYEPQEEVIQQAAAESDYIYPDHSYEPETTSARKDLEDKYEKYLDDLYFDEKEVPLGEQLAKDEEQYGSLTRKEYKPRPVEEAPQQVAPEKPVVKKAIPRNETPEEMEARIRAEILEEQKSLKDKHGDDKNIHNLNYQEEKEPMGVVDILLTLVLIIVILIVLYYIIYLFFLNATYTTFMDAVFALKNPQNVINHLLTSIQQ